MSISDQGGLLRARSGAEERVTPLELFFDLVFVFALTQVTAFLSDHLTWIGMLQGAALLVVLWAAWGGYSWLTNAVPAEDVIPARLLIFLAMAAMFVASLAVPDAFGRYGVLFGSAYVVVWLVQVLLYVLATGREPVQRRAMLRLAARGERVQENLQQLHHEVSHPEEHPVAAEGIGDGERGHEHGSHRQEDQQPRWDHILCRHGVCKPRVTSPRRP